MKKKRLVGIVNSTEPFPWFVSCIVLSMFMFKDSSFLVNTWTIPNAAIIGTIIVLLQALRPRGG